MFRLDRATRLRGRAGAAGADDFGGSVLNCPAAKGDGLKHEGRTGNQVRCHRIPAV
jgi:hypothetical protein